MFNSTIIIPTECGWELLSLEQLTPLQLFDKDSGMWIMFASHLIDFEKELDLGLEQLLDLVYFGKVV